MQSIGKITFTKEAEIKKEEAKQEPTDQEKIKQLLQKGQQTLLQIHTVFPFDLFPDTLIIDTNKVSIVNSEFFYSGQIHSVALKDIGEVSVETSLLFATLKITVKADKENSIVLRFLKKGEALEARRLIEGLIITNEQKIDLSKFGKQDIIKKLEELGKTI